MISKNIKYLKVIFLVTSMFFFSCAQNPNLVPSSYSTILNLVSDRFLNTQDQIDPNVIKEIPYASSLINFKGSPKSLIILETKSNNSYTWISADKKVFYTKEGRIIATIGLSNDLYKIRRPNLTFRDILDSDGETTYFSYYSFKKPTLNDLKVKTTSKVVGKKKIKILDMERDLMLIEEQLVSQKINWKKTNKFWVDPESLMVWKSEQYLSPRLPLLYFEVTKKPAN